VSTRGGIDLGGTKIQTVVVDDGNAVIGEARHPTPKDSGPEGVVTAMANALKEAAQAAGVEPAALEGVGVGSPGSVDPQTGAVEQAINVIAEWKDSVPVAAELSTALGTKVRVGNDVNVATDAEFELGAGREFQSMLGVFWGTGVGGGVILDGKLWEGRGAAGEIGHMVVKIDGALCGCGRRGCMEAYAGRGSMELEARRRHDDGHHTELFKIMKHKGRERLSSGVWAKALEDEDHLAQKLIDRAVGALGAGVASAINLLDLECVIIGGGMGTRLGEEYAPKILDAMMPHLFKDNRPPTVRVAALGDLGGAIGAALLAGK
jgi:glucokinase